MKITTTQVNTLINYLQGTCMSMSESCEDLNFSEDDLTIKQLQEIDNWIFQCSGCGWWCERGEAHDVNGEDMCDDCYEEWQE